jgi:hypothetical protein
MAINLHRMKLNKKTKKHFIHKNENRCFSILSITERVSRILSFILIPIILGNGAWQIQKIISEESINQEYVKLAISILSSPDDQIDQILREYAVNLLVLNSPIDLPDEAITNLISGDISLPATIINTDIAGTVSVPDTVELIKSFYLCINNSRATPDFEGCWNYLSDRPGEFQSTQSEGLSGFIYFWNRFNVRADIYSCENNIVSVVQQYYLRTDISKPINPDQFEKLEYSLAFDNEGWRIRSGIVVNALRSSCENQPLATVTPDL